MRKGKKKVKKKEVKNPRMMNNITEERFVELQKVKIAENITMDMLYI